VKPWCATALERLCEEKGWHVAEVYSDRALSGASTLRPGYQKLLADARSRKFDVVVAEGIDRLSREQVTTAVLFQQLSFIGIMIYTRADGEVSELHVGLKGTMNALFLKDLALKTHRGLEGRVRQGKSGGGKAYGYRVAHQHAEDGNMIRGDREIVAAEAAIVRRILAEFAAGKSTRAIARDLNRENIKGPSGKPWRDTTIRGHATRRTGILRNDLYAGCLLWNKQTYRRNPDTGKRVARPRHEGERIATEVPALRIVDQDVWECVQRRLDVIRASPASRNLRATECWMQLKHLLTGLVTCGEGGGLMAAVGKDYLACTAARSEAGCSNRKSIRRARVEEVVLEGLKVQLMAPELVEEFTRAFHEEVNRQNSMQELRVVEHQTELVRISKKLKGLYDAIADGLRTPGLKDQLLELEARQTELKELIERASPPAARLHPKLAEVYRAIVADLQAALSDPNTRVEANEILRGLIERITVRNDPHGQVVELTGDIVKLLTLPGGSIPVPFDSSVKVVAVARNFHKLLFCACGLEMVAAH
jgi:DNA invertase Pin-like site-specific DNA recombinase